MPPARKRRSPKAGAPKRGAPKRGAPKGGARKAGAPKDAPKRGTPNAAARKAGTSKQRDPQAERARWAAVTAKQGNRITAAPLFERGSAETLAGGQRVAPGRIALVEQVRGGVRVVRELGSLEVARDVVDALLTERGPGPIARAMDEEAAEVAASPPGAMRSQRRDLRELATFTVDPASARDFDDAISASRSGDGVILWVHIADVAAHILPGTKLDAEALRRANSTYVPGTVEPMLPHALSSDACSLTPGTERLAVTTEIELNGAGAVAGVSFYRSVVRSDARLSYEDLDRFFSGDEQPPATIVEPIELARRVAAGLARNRAPGLEVHGSEPEFRFEGGDVVSAVGVPQTEAHRLIEQLMVKTNELVAELCERKRVPTLYRVHEQPDPERIRVMLDQLAALGVPTPPAPKQIAPGQAGELAVAASTLCAREAARRGHGREAYTTIVLRSLKQAQYNERNLGHAGLGSPAYAHFTSPIRRYPDLIAHRALLAASGAGENAPRAENLAGIALHCSERERDASRLERDADQACAAFLLQRELVESGPGAPFDGEVIGVISAGAFVRFAGKLADIYEGFLPARVLGGRERYEIDPLETMLVGRDGGPSIRLGDPVSVTVDRVEAPRGRVDLLPVVGKPTAGAPGGQRR